jgi:hypothetical protein
MASVNTQNCKVSVECFGMSSPEELKRIELAEKLRQVDQQLRSEMLARGFDPAQGDNVALTAPLAKLYMEREDLRAELDSLADRETQLFELQSTMTEVQKIVDQLNRAFAGEAWHGPAVMSILDGITAPQGGCPAFPRRAQYLGNRAPHRSLGARVPEKVGRRSGATIRC